jgi:LemA protein
VVTGITLVALAVVGGAWLAALYNGLVHLRNDIDRAWANVDVLLLQRADELPNLVEVCRGYAKHERETLEAVVRAGAALRAAPDPAGRSAGQEGVNAALARLYGLVEAYPALRADAAFARLQQRITAIEDELADRRELFNASVARYNTRLAQLPEALIARWLDLRPRAPFAASPRALPGAGPALPPPAMGAAPRSARTDRAYRR